MEGRALIVSAVARSTTGCYGNKVLCLGLLSSFIASSKNGSASFPGPVILLYVGGNYSNILSVWQHQTIVFGNLDFISRNSVIVSLKTACLGPSSVKKST